MAKFTATSPTIDRALRCTVSTIDGDLDVLIPLEMPRREDTVGGAETIHVSSAPVIPLMNRKARRAAKARAR